MKLTDLTRGYIESFSGSTIFGRGMDYHVTGRVLTLEYDEDAATITADVSGNYGDYFVEVCEEDGEIEADCDCPYDGYPCKHVVAVMLGFLGEKDKHVKKSKAAKTQIDSLKIKLGELSKEELVDMVMGCARKYLDFKSELMVRFAENKQKAIDTIRKEIKRAFPYMGDSYSPPQIARRLKTIAKSVDDASNAVKVEIYWAIADRILEELNEYGMDDEALEGVAIDRMESLVSLLKGDDELRQKKQEILRGLMKHYETGNCGLVDSVYETAHDLLEDKSDYQIVIEHIERMAKSHSFSSYYTGLLAGLYEELGDEEASLKTLESNLQYGMDYWRLAEYWIERGQDDKALDIVKVGIDKGEGRKEELYIYMQEYHRRQNDYDAILRIFKSKFEGQRGYYIIANDETYRLLMDHYESTDDYAGKAKLLNLRLSCETNPDFQFYEEAEGMLRESDWRSFEKKFIARIEKRGIHRDHDLLAQIYDYKDDTGKLWSVIKKSPALLRKYEKKLISKYPEEYLRRYEEIVDQYIAGRGRDNYRAAAEYAARIKIIQRTILKQPEKWEQYIENLRTTNKQLRAMKEEFSRL